MKRLLELRQTLDKSQREIAEELMIPKSSYGNYELGNREADYATLKRMASYFNVTTDFLLEVDTKKSFQMPEKINNYAEAVAFLKDLNLLPYINNNQQQKIIMFAQMIHFTIINYKW